MIRVFTKRTGKAIGKDMFFQGKNWCDPNGVTLSAWVSYAPIYAFTVAPHWLVHLHLMTMTKLIWHLLQS